MGTCAVVGFERAFEEVLRLEVPPVRDGDGAFGARGFGGDGFWDGGSAFDAVVGAIHFCEVGKVVALREEGEKLLRGEECFCINFGGELQMMSAVVSAELFFACAADW